MQKQSKYVKQTGYNEPKNFQEYDNKLYILPNSILTKQYSYGYIPNGISEKILSGQLEYDQVYSFSDIIQENINKYKEHKEAFQEFFNELDPFVTQKDTDLRLLDVEKFEEYVMGCLSKPDQKPGFKRLMDEGIFQMETIQENGEKIQTEPKIIDYLTFFNYLAQNEYGSFLTFERDDIENKITKMNSLKMDSFYEKKDYEVKVDVKGIIESKDKQRTDDEKESMKEVANQTKKARDANYYSDIVDDYFMEMNDIKDKETMLKLRDEIDSKVDGVPNSKLALDNFYERFAGCKKEDFNNLSQDQLNQIKNNGLYAHALNTYARLNEIHEKRGVFFWLFHPNQNKAEKQALAEMKDVLQNKLGVSKEELSPYRKSKDGQKYLYRPSSGDEIVEKITFNLDEEKNSKLIDINIERYVQIDRIKKGYFEENNINKKLLSEDDQFQLKKDTQEVQKTVSKVQERKADTEIKIENNK